MFTSEEWDRLLKMATAGSAEARRILDQQAAVMREDALVRLTRGVQLAPLPAAALLAQRADTSRNPDGLLAVA